MSWLQAGLGLVGMLDSAGRNRQADRYAAEAARSAAEDAAWKRKMRAIAEGYDPAAETEAAVKYASDRAGMAAQQSLGKLNSTFRKYGGQPGGDTNFRFASDQEMRRVMNPLAEFSANQKSQETARKMGIYQAALGGPDMTGTYMGLSEATKVNPAASAEIFAGGIEGTGIFNRSPVGGTGVAPSTVATGKSRQLVDRFKMGRYQNDPDAITGAKYA